MNKRDGMRTLAALVGVACAGAVGAQEINPDELPPERNRPATCQQVNWNDAMLEQHPNLVEACQEAVVVDGTTWARLAASFEEVEEDGDVRFQIQDRLRSNVGEVTIEPAPGQVAYINERRTPFEELDRGQQVNLYVPEGQYGFASLPGAPMSQVARVSGGDPGAMTASAQDRDAAATQRPDDADPVLARLPATAGPLPWLAFGGALSVLGGIGLGLRRRFFKG